jgi:hypothetical protein
MPGLRRRSSTDEVTVDPAAGDLPAGIATAVNGIRPDTAASAVDGTGAGATSAAKAAVAPAPKPRHFSAVRESLGIRDFRFLFFGSISSGYAQWAQQIGVGVLTYELTNDSAAQWRPLSRPAAWSAWSPGRSWGPSSTVFRAARSSERTCDGGAHTPNDMNLNGRSPEGQLFHAED